MIAFTLLSPNYVTETAQGFLRVSGPRDGEDLIGSSAGGSWGVTGQEADREAGNMRGSHV